MSAWLALCLVATAVQGQQLEWQGQVLPNNSLVDLTAVSPLTCSTTSTPCCDEWVWRLPNMTIVSESVNDSLTVTRGNQSLSLSWTNGTTPLSGIYSCSLIESNITLYVGVYPSTAPSHNGTLVTPSLTYDPRTQTLTCTSREGPVTMVTWLKDGFTLNTSDRISQSQVIRDTVDSEYINTLTIKNKTGTDSGQYECRLNNSLGMVSMSLDLELCEQGLLRRQGSYFDLRVEVCSEDVWTGVVVSSQTPTLSQAELDITLRATETTLSVRWSGRNTELAWHQIVCKNGRQSLTILEEGDAAEVTISGTLPNTTYTCCVHALINSTEMFFTYSRGGCAEVTTASATPLTLIEIALIAVVGALTAALLLVVGSCCCALWRSKHRQGQYEVQMKEQSNHYTKQNIKVMPYARFPADNDLSTISETDVVFNKSAERSGSPPVKSEHIPPTQGKKPTPAAGSTPVTKPPLAPKPKDTALKPLKPTISPGPRPSQVAKDTTTHPTDEDQPVYAEPGTSPTSHQQEEGDNPIYGVPVQGKGGDTSPTEKDQPVYEEPDQSPPGKQGENPMYGVVSRDDGELEELLSQEESEGDNPLYGKVR